MAKSVTYPRILDLKFPGPGGARRYHRFRDATDFSTVEWINPDDPANPTKEQCDALWPQVQLELRCQYDHIILRRFPRADGSPRFTTIRDTLYFNTVEWADPDDPTNPTKEQCDALRAEVAAEMKAERHARRCYKRFAGDGDRMLKALECLTDTVGDLLDGKPVSAERIARFQKLRSRMEDARAKMDELAKRSTD